jgi:hypothetical protein
MLRQIKSGRNAILLAACALLAGNSHSQTGASNPTQINAHYRIHKSGILIGTVEERFTRDGDTYKIVSETHTAGALKWLLNDQVTLSAEGRIGPTGLEPTHYQLKRHNDPTKDISATFAYDKNQIISNHHDKTESFALPVGTLDRISAIYHFAFVTPLTTEVTFWMSQGKEAEQYRYRKQGETVIKVGDISYSTVHYARVITKGRSQVQLWLAKDRHYVPVRIVFEDSHGITLEQTLVDLQTH